MRAYLAGPMTGYPDYNFPEFHRVADELRSQGHEVLSPADLDENGKGMPRSYIMRLDIFLIVGNGRDMKPVEAIFVLDRWWESRGARLEVEIACQLDLPVYWAESGRALSQSDWELARCYDHPDYLTLSELQAAS